MTKITEIWICCAAVLDISGAVDVQDLADLTDERKLWAVVGLDEALSSANTHLRERQGVEIRETRVWREDRYWVCDRDDPNVGVLCWRS